MVTKESLQEKYAAYSIAQLLDIINNKTGYTDLAISIATEELSLREVSEEEVEKYDVDKAEQTKLLNERAAERLTLQQKLLFYFIWPPVLTSAFKSNFREGGYSLKYNQANFYAALGFISIIISGFVGGGIIQSSWAICAIWLLLFALTYYLDDHFNQQPALKKMHQLQ